MSNRKEWFRSLEAISIESRVTVGDNCTVLVKGIGSIPFVTAGGKEKLIIGVLYVPNLCKNLLSIN